MSLFLLFASLFSSVWLTGFLTRDALLLAPAVTMLAWSLFLGTLVGNAVPVSAIWWPFWLLTSASAAISASLYVRQWRSVWLIVVPAISALVVLTPWLYYGIRFYPGSWFWDGFAYLAAAETLWRYPITTPSEGLEPLFMLGQSTLQFRFIGSSLIAVFRDVLPIGAGSDGSVGFFLIACLVTYACSCSYLARRYLAPNLQNPFTILAVVSGPIVNLVWANNFDHLLALSIAPALLGFAMEFSFERRRHAVFIGSASAAMLFIYPELVTFLLLPAGLTLVFRILGEKPQYRTVLLIIVVAFALTVSPLALFIQKFMAYQWSAISRSAELRPGNGYFPTLLHFNCVYGALTGLYAPFQPCESTAQDALKFHLGLILTVAIAVGGWMRRDAISLSVMIIISATLYFLLKQHYDYAAFKLLSSGTHLFVLLAISTLATNRVEIRWIGKATAVAFISFAVLKVLRLNDVVRFKSLKAFSEIAQYIPADAVVAIKVSDPLKFEWAAYYLRNHKSVPVEGRFIYLEPNAFARPPFIERGLSYTYVLSDTDQADKQMVWKNSLYQIYRVARN